MLLPMPLTIVVEVWVYLCECSSFLVTLLAVIYETDSHSYKFIYTNDGEE